MLRSPGYTHTYASAERRMLQLEALAPPLVHRSFDLGFKIQRLPKIYDGHLYCFDLKGGLHCVALKDGAKKWTTRLQRGRSSPSFDEGIPIIGGDFLLILVEGKLYRVSLADGVSEPLALEECGVWDGVVSQDMFCYSWINADDALEYVGYSLSQKKILWRMAAPGTHTEITLVNGCVVVEYSKQVLRAVDLQDGTVRWQLDLESPIHSSIIFDGSNIVLGMENQKIVVIDPGSGTLLHTVHVGESPLQLCGIGEHVLVLLTNENLYRFAKADDYVPTVIAVSSQLKEINVPHDCTRCSASGSHLYFAEQFSATVCAMNMANGKIEWTGEIPGGISFAFAPGVVEGGLWIVDLNGDLHGYGPIS